MFIPDRGLYLIFDPQTWSDRTWERSLGRIAPYLAMVQLRSPSLDGHLLSGYALKIREILSGKIPLIINNSVDIAISAGAQGVHLGKEDMTVRSARKIFGGIIGASCHTPRAAAKAAAEGADYIGCGPIFKTSTKVLDRKPLGPGGYLKVKRAAGIPVIPIGGINEENIPRVLKYSGIVAVSSLLSCSGDPLGLVRSLDSLFTFKDDFSNIC